MEIIITGCSHSSGTEMLDHQIFGNDYKTMLKKNTDPEFRFKYICRFLLNRFKGRSKSILRKLATEKNQSHPVILRYFQNLERKKAWPETLKKHLPDHEISNFSKQGSSIKFTVRTSLRLMKKIQHDCIFVHQLPSSQRTYRRVDNDLFHFNAGISNHKEYHDRLKKYYDKRKKIWKNILIMDLKHNHFNRSNRKYLEILKDKSPDFVKHFFICTDQTQCELIKNIFGYEKIIIENFETLLSSYAKGFGHVIDPAFNEDMSEKIKNFFKSKKFIN